MIKISVKVINSISPWEPWQPLPGISAQNLPTKPLPGYETL